MICGNEFELNRPDSFLSQAPSHNEASYCLLPCDDLLDFIDRRAQGLFDGLYQAQPPFGHSRQSFLDISVLTLLSISALYRYLSEVEPLSVWPICRSRPLSIHSWISLTPVVGAASLHLAGTCPTINMSPRLLNGGSVDPFADPSMSVFETCSIQANGDASALLQCISDVHEESQQLQTVDTLSWLLVMAGAFVFFMQTGFAMLCAGCVRRKNVQNTMLKNLLDACGAAIAFYMFGYAFAFGGQNDRTDITFIGLDNFFLMGNVDAGFFFFEFAFCATTATIVAGTLAERCQMAAYLCYSLFLSGFVYPIVVHAIWSNNGFLSAFSSDPINGIGTIDFAGSGVVHLTGGTTALVAAYILGPRRGRFYDSRGRPLSEPKVIPGHSIALQLMGTFTLWFGCT